MASSWSVKALSHGEADFQERRSAIGVPLHLSSFFLFLAALLAISLIDGGPVLPRTQSAAREIVASATAEFVHDRVQIEMPRIITWRPLPVAARAPSTRGRPRSVPTPTPNRESGDAG